MNWLNAIWDWLSDPANRDTLAWLGAGLAAIAAAAWTLYTHFARRASSPSNAQTISASPATASDGSIAVVATGDVTIDRDPLVEQAFEALKHQLQDKERALDAARQTEQAAQAREQSLQDALHEALAAIPKQTDIRDAGHRIKEALNEASNGKTQVAEAIFLEVEARKVAEGEAAYKEAAEAARHRGALAFLHDTEAALAAYRRATSLDPENADGWNQLGHLLLRVGELHDGEAAYRKVESIGRATDDKKLLADAYGNLGSVYATRGDLEAAEAMYQEALALDETLGHKEGIATAYGNLGSVYATRGDLEAAEAMYQEALALDETLGHKEGMATDYTKLGLVYATRGDLEASEAMHQKALALFEALGHKEGIAGAYTNLGGIYYTRGDLEAAEAMYQKALDIFRTIGARPMVEQIREFLAELKKERTSRAE